jgi:hypothetical protein
MGRVSRLSRPVAGIGALLSLYITAGASYGIYVRWHRGGILLGASIFAVILFGLNTIICGRHFANPS